MNNFDELLSTMTGKTHRVTVRGEVYDIPASLPAIYYILSAQARERAAQGYENDGERITDTIYRNTILTRETLIGLYGQETVDGWVNDHISQDEYAKILELSIRTIYGVSDGETDIPKVETSS